MRRARASSDRGRRAARGAHRRSPRSPARRPRPVRARRTSGRGRPSTACSRSSDVQKAWIVLTRAASIARSSLSQSSWLSLVGAASRALVALVADAAAHLAGGRVGERDGDQLVQLGRFLNQLAVVVEVREKPLGEHERLAATGAGRERDRRVARVERVGLFVGECGGRRHRRYVIVPHRQTTVCRGCGPGRCGRRWKTRSGWCNGRRGWRRGNCRARMSRTKRPICSTTLAAQRLPVFARRFADPANSGARSGRRRVTPLAIDQ